MPTDVPARRESTALRKCAQLARLRGAIGLAVEAEAELAAIERQREELQQDDERAAAWQILDPTGRPVELFFRDEAKADEYLTNANATVPRDQRWGKWPLFVRPWRAAINDHVEHKSDCPVGVAEADLEALVRDAEQWRLYLAAYKRGSHNEEIELYDGTSLAGWRAGHADAARLSAPPDSTPRTDP